MFYKNGFIRAILISSLFFLSSSSAFSQTSADFFAPRAYDGGIGFATGDLNNDGRLDVVSAKADSLLLLTGAGSGRFNDSPTTVFSCSRFSSNAFKIPLIGDFTGDGVPDIAAWMEDN